MSFSGKKPFGWHVDGGSSHPANHGSRSSSRLSQTFSAQSKRFFGFSPLPEEKVEEKVVTLLKKSGTPKPAPSGTSGHHVLKARSERKRLHLPRISPSSSSRPSTNGESRLNTSSPSTSSGKSRISPLRSLSSNFDFSPYSSPTRSTNMASQSQTTKPASFHEYLGGVPDLVQFKSQSRNTLADRDFLAAFPEYNRLMASNKLPHDERSGFRKSGNGNRNHMAHDVQYFASDLKNNRRIRFDDNVQRIASDNRPISSSNGTELSAVYIVEDVDSSGSSDDVDDTFEYNPDRERSMLACRLGILPDHSDLLWIVDECILESSKDPWQLCFKKSKVMYHNRRTGEV